MPRLLLIRHGQASFGATDYDRLSELGVRQAEVTAAALADAGVAVDRVVCGSLRRQRDTAAPIAAAGGLPDPDVDARLNEYDGDEILLHHSDAAVRLERPEPGAVPREPREFQATLEAALRGWIDAGSGSPAAETFPAFGARVAEALSDAAGSGASTTVLCSSGGVIAAIAAALTGAGDRSFVALNRVAVNCGLTRVIAGRAGVSLLSFNEQLHLPAEMISYR